MRVYIPNGRAQPGHTHQRVLASLFPQELPVILSGSIPDCVSLSCVL